MKDQNRFIYLFYVVNGLWHLDFFDVDIDHANITLVLR